VQRTAAVCLPHDWLTWMLGGSGRLSALATDRSDASGTGYWSPATGRYRPDLLRLAFGRQPLLPEVMAPSQASGNTNGGALLGPGAGDNAAAALGVGADEGDVIVSIGTSGGLRGEPAPLPTRRDGGSSASASGDFCLWSGAERGPGAGRRRGGLCDADPPRRRSCASVARLSTAVPDQARAGADRVRGGKLDGQQTELRCGCQHPACR
jgi:hypothetical protein